MIELDFAAFDNRYPGATAWVVGRGPTRFPYEDLATADGPVFFINDAVGQEVHLRPGQPSFFFAHHRSMACWLPALRSVAVLVTDHVDLVRGREDPVLATAGEVVLYTRDGAVPQEQVLELGRDELARHRQLCIRSGTVHPLLHFAWYAGCASVRFIGCDGIPDSGYDPRLENRSRTRHYVLGPLIRRDQEEIARRLGMTFTYLGTPRAAPAVSAVSAE
jgi:hypothetical protein